VINRQIVPSHDKYVHANCTQRNAHNYVGPWPCLDVFETSGLSSLPWLRVTPYGDSTQQLGHTSAGNVIKCIVTHCTIHLLDSTIREHYLSIDMLELEFNPRQCPKCDRHDFTESRRAMPQKHSLSPSVPFWLSPIWIANDQHESHSRWVRTFPTCSVHLRHCAQPFNKCVIVLEIRLVSN